MLRDNTLRFALTWVVLPNLPYVVLSIEYCPVRTSVILLYVMIGLTWSIIGPLAAVPLFLATAAIDAIAALSKIFGIPMWEMLGSVGNVVHLHLGSHWPYLGLGTLAAASAGGTLALAFSGMQARRRHRPVQPILPAMAMAFVAIGADVAANRELTYGLKPLGLLSDHVTALRPDIGGAVASATGLSGIEAAAGSGRTVLVVMVEALGQFRDDALNRRLAGVMVDEAISERYEVSTGTVPFNGSTTAGELREMCQRDDSYLHFRAGLPEDASCLPLRLGRQGYETVALHGFTNQFFDRRTWYPVIGFQRMVFLEDVDDGRYCGNLFEGHCDDRMLGLVRAELARPGGPRLVYWLTLDSHYPVPQPAECGEERSQSCSMMTKWAEVLAGIRELALDPGLPPMDILVVGDHAPPMFKRSERGLFHRDVVPWIALKAKSATP
ncbi:MAG: sulfatase-like hydrolase/transferase [Pseudomonadota bacterium]